MSIDRASIARVAALGTLSGVVCAQGGRLLPEPSLALDLFPGLVFGATLFVAAHTSRRLRPRARARSLLVLLAAGMAGWRAAIDIAFVHGEPVPFVAAGALGALIVAVAARWVWRTSAPWPWFLTVVTLAGVLGGWIARVSYEALGPRHETLWLHVLFVEWQTLVLVTIGAACALERERTEFGTR